MKHLLRSTLGLLIAIGTSAALPATALAVDTPFPKADRVKGDLEVPSKPAVQTAQAAGFECRTTDGIHYTVALRGNGAASQAIIVWTSEELVGYPPQRRCREVSDRLNNVLRSNGNTLAGLYLTVGRVNGQSVVCTVGDVGYGCNTNNVLFTLSGENARDPNQVLLSLRDRVSGAGTPIEQISNNGQVYIDFEALVDRHF